MSQEIKFAQTLAETLKLARRQHNVLLKKQIDDAFSFLELDKQKQKQVYEYFREHKVNVTGEESAVRTGEESGGQSTVYATALSAKELEEVFLNVLENDSAARARMIEAYLPMVEDIARLYEEQGVLREDLIGEGNVALVEGCGMLEACETLAEAEHALSGFVMNAMEALIKRTMQDVADDEKTLARVNDAAEKAAKLAGEYHRNLTIEEFLDETEYTAEELSDVLRLTGWKMEGLELSHE